MSHLKPRSLVAALAVAAVLAWLVLNGMLAAGGELSGIADAAATLTTIFLGIFIEAAAFLLLGTLASGLVEVYVRYDLSRRYVPRDVVRGVLAVGSRQSAVGSRQWHAKRAETIRCARRTFVTF